MASKESWLKPGAGDLKEETIKDVPVKGESVKVRGLPAAYSNQASSEALEMKTVGREQIATVNTGTMEELQFLHGVIEPTFDPSEVEQIFKTHGPAVKKVIEAIDRLSGVDKESLRESAAAVPSGAKSEGD